MHQIRTIQFDADESRLIEHAVLPLAGLADDWHQDQYDAWRAIRSVARGMTTHSAFVRALTVVVLIRDRAAAQTDPAFWGAMPHADGLAEMRCRDVAQLDVVIDLLTQAVALTDDFPKRVED